MCLRIKETSYFLQYICSEPEAELVGAGQLLKKYVGLLCAHVADILPLAASLAAYTSKHFVVVSAIVSRDVAGKIILLKQATIVTN